MIDLRSSGSRHFAQKSLEQPSDLSHLSHLSLPRPPSSAIDGDLETYWATETGYPSAEFHLDLGTSMLVMVGTSGHGQ